ncbi:MAG: phosphoribosylformylglycinamidine synthase I [Actinomycetia bacterium]|nr:phosphoribosylformylglycinamidine synthase I [Actinomycetes bacterium]
MTIAVVVFPGTNCEHDARYALALLGSHAELVWHRDDDLSGATGVVLPGGFAHGDYLRTGAIARFSPVMAEVERLARQGTPTLGICNGFQILCEAGLLPGALVANRDLRFICRTVTVRVESTDSILTSHTSVGDLLQIPLNSYEGNYVLPAAIDGAPSPNVVLRYCDSSGASGKQMNPNGSTDSIAAVADANGTIVGVMPHPERAVEDILGSTDGRVLLESFVSATASVVA